MTKETGAEMAKVYGVGGMTCEGCAAAVTRAIKTKAPGATVEVDLQGARVSVDGFDDESAIRDAVDGAGFDFHGPAA